MTVFRAELSNRLQPGREGNEVVVTDRGTPIVRLVPVAASARLDELTASGVIGAPKVAERPPVGKSPRPKPTRPVAEIVADQRR